MAGYLDQLASADENLHNTEMISPQVMTHPRLPHFIIIGAMKSATTTLQEQLVGQPGIFMSTPKEPNFFGDDEQFRKGLGWYQSLFISAPHEALLGEASTHYTKLPTYPETVARMHALLPNARLVYVMRHPVDRLVSHYIHEWSMSTISCDINEAVSCNPELIAYSRYAHQLQPYFDTYGRENVLPVFFERLIACPQQELERICSFIGYPERPIWQTDLPPSNVSQQRIRRFPLYDLLVGSTMMTYLRRTVIPKSWRQWTKDKLTMRTRPTLSSTVRTSLESELDRDLAILGAWLGVPLTCANFKSATSQTTLDWSERNA